MDEDAIQDAMIIRMAAELLKGLANVTEPGEDDAVGAAANPDAVSLPHLLGDEASAAITGGEPKPAVLSEASPEVAKETIAAIAPLVDAQQIATPEATPLPKSEAAEPEEASELPPPPSPTGQPASKPVFEPMPQPAASPPQVATLEPPQPAVSPAPVATLEPPQPAVSPAPVATLEPPQPAVSPAPVATLEPPQPAVSPAPVATLEPPQPAVSPAPVATLEPPQPAVSPAPVATLEPPQPAAAIQKPDSLPYDDLYGRFSKTYEWSPAVTESRSSPNIAEDALESGHDLQLAETPEPIAVGDSDTSKPSLSPLPDYDLGRRFDDTHEFPLAINYREHQRFLAENAEVIESLRATPQQRWTPKQRQQAKEIREVKEDYHRRISGLPKPPEPPPSPVPAFGSERTIETENLFAAQRPAAQPPTWVTPEGVPTGQPAEQAWLQAAVEAATPAEFVGLEPPPASLTNDSERTDETKDPLASKRATQPEGPISPEKIIASAIAEQVVQQATTNIALAAIPEEYRGSLAGSPLALDEAAQFERSAPIVDPETLEELPVRAEVVPTSMWTRMGRKARQAFHHFFPPLSAPPLSQPQPQLDPSSFSEGTKKHPRSVFSQPEEGEPLPSDPDDDDFWSAIPPIAVGNAPGGRRRRNSGGLFDALTGGQRGSRGGAPGGSHDVMHVWVDGGQLQVVDHINTIGAITGKTVPLSSPSPATGPQNNEETSAGLAGLLGGAEAGGAAAGLAVQQSIQPAASFLGHPEVGQVAGDVASTSLTVGAIALVNPFAALGMAVAVLPQKIIDWSNALIEGKRDIAAFSGQLQYVFGEKERREAIRGIQTADTVAPSTSLLSDQYQDLLDEVRPIKDAVTQDIQNLMLVLVEALRGVVFVAGIAQKISDDITVLGWIRKAVDKISKSLDDSSSDTNFEEWAKFVRSGMGALPTIRPVGAP